MGEFALLERIGGPSDVQALDVDDLVRLAGELRQFIVRSVSDNPGHLGASLGVVELTVALLASYTPPNDRIVWDVGHQAYGYKILTGRRDTFGTNRQLGGICGFPSRAESEYDAFGVGHSSTSISAALGMASAIKLRGEDARTVAIIGDGALTGGMAFEALNNGGASMSDILVILNDNDMSIDPNVGALHQYLLDIATSPQYNRLKDRIWHVLSGARARSGIRHRASRLNKTLKSIFLRSSNLFEAFGFRYFGPIDGHDLPHLLSVLRDLREIPGPKLLHCRTKKGKGYAPAEQEQVVWHAPGRFNARTGVRAGEGPAAMKYQDVFGEHLLRLAQRDERIVGITAAMPTGTSLSLMMRELPERCFDVGIAEQHAVTFAAGLATEGFIPVCAIYSTFLQRAYDQIVHDVALQNLHVVFCVDRAGVVGEDGATHHGVFDLAYLQPVPNVTVCSPLNEVELRAMMDLAVRGCGPWFIRYPRGHGEGLVSQELTPPLEVGQGHQLREGSRVAVLSIGPVGNAAIQALDEVRNEGILAAHYDLRFAKPFPSELVRQAIAHYDCLITLEDGAVRGGVAAAVDSLVVESGRKAEVIHLGVPDAFVPHGTVAQLQARCGYSPGDIARALRQAWARASGSAISEVAPALSVEPTPVAARCETVARI